MFLANGFKSTAAPANIGRCSVLPQPGAACRILCTLNEFQVKQRVFVRQLINAFVGIFLKGNIRRNKTRFFKLLQDPGSGTAGSKAAFADDFISREPFSFGSQCTNYPFVVFRMGKQRFIEIVNSSFRGPSFAKHSRSITWAALRLQGLLVWPPIFSALQYVRQSP